MYNERRDPLTVRREMLVAPPRIIGIRRASNSQLRQGIYRMTARVPPAVESGLGDMPSEETCRRKGRR